MGVRGRLLIFAVVVAVPLAVVGAIVLNGLWTTSRRELDQSVKQQAELAAIAYERWIDTQQEPLTTLAAFVSEHKLEAASYRDTLRYLVQTRPHWIDLSVISAAGETLAAEPAGSERPAPALVNYLLTTTRDRKTWMVVTDRTHDESEPVVAIAVPVSGDGAVIARIDGVAINELFRGIQLREGSVIAVFDQDRNILYRRQASAMPLDREVNGSPLINALGTQQASVVEIESPYDGIRRIYGLAHAGATQSVVVVGIPSTTLYEPARQKFTLYLYVSLLTLGCALIAGLILARGITGPISVLVRATHAFGSGDLTARSSVIASGEVGDLSSSFNTMADQISEREQALQELDRLKSDFVSGVSHELRTPLTTIKTLTHVLQRGGNSKEDEREYLETIAAECDRQIDLVLNLLDLSRIESGVYRINLVEVSAAEVVKAAVARYQHAAELRDQELIAQLSDGAPRVRADRSALQRALAGLIENAIKYSPDQGKIIVGVQPVNGEVGLYVTDNGCGIRRDDLGRIFERFYRGSVPQADDDQASSANVAEERPGVGLGLYMVSNIVDQMGGRVEVQSEPMQGSTFTIFLPQWTAPGEDLNVEEITCS